MALDPVALVIAGMIFTAIVLALVGITSGSQSQTAAAARQRLEGWKRGAEPEASTATRAPARERLLSPMLHGVTDGVRSLLPTSLLKGVEKQLIYAGEPMTMQGFLTMLVITGSAATGLGLLLVVVMGAKLSLMSLGIVVAMGAVGFFMPFYLIRSRARQRQHAIIRSLADAFDLITTCVEAGLGLDAALARVAEKVEGPFAQELNRALRDVALGKARREALKELGDRTGVMDLIQFVNAVIQAEAMGSSIGTVLRVQADTLRVRRRQRAEEAAYKAP
ncbi:MAG: type II secretion system F family protein, partial [Chloroflexi bacterium]|nr:type II secretion system F family protein [Chloroflexota bacterium]